ncbi:hypothetical protein IMZ48_10190 [Candidatus Bathyarchaeota archaeon]|nr:hypothetical protein [Candidatus Bathyarchaeota archaeon]
MKTEPREQEMLSQMFARRPPKRQPAGEAGQRVEMAWLEIVGGDGVAGWWWLNYYPG